jgi:hypothetical protein
MAVIVKSIEETEANDSKSARVSLMVTAVTAGTATAARGELTSAGYTLGASYSGGVSSGAKLSNLTYSPVEDSGGQTWTATATYTDDAQSETAASFTKIESSTRAEIVDIWRTGASFPASLDNPSETDISGTAVDARGVPVSTIVVQQELTYTVRMNFTNSDQSTVNSMIGTRNSANFLGGTAGYVLFTGCRRSRIAVDLYEVTYSFVWDGAAHLRQVPKRNADGDPEIATTGAYIGKTAEVYAKQPFPSTSNFNGLPGI